MDLRLFKNSRFLAGNIILLCTQVVVMSLTYWAVWLQQGLGFSAIEAGLGLLPAGLPILITARVGGIWLDKYGPKLPITVGSVIVLLGLIWLVMTAHFQSYPLAFFGFLAYGIGAPLVISPAIALVLGSVEAAHRGMAAGIFNTMRQLGATLCFAIVGVIISNLNQIASASHSSMLTHTYTPAFTGGMIAASLFALVSCVFAVGFL